MRTAHRYPVSFALAVLLAIGSIACGDKPSTKDCEKLLDHVIEIEVAAAGTDQLSPEMKADLDKQKGALRETLKATFMEQCSEKTSGSYVKCGLAARSLEEFAKCDRK